MLMRADTVDHPECQCRSRSLLCELRICIEEEAYNHDEQHLAHHLSWNGNNHGNQRRQHDLKTIEGFERPGERMAASLLRSL